MLLSSGVESRRRGATMRGRRQRELPGTFEVLVEEYRAWLVAECCLAPRTVGYLVTDAMLFLSEHGQELSGLTLSDVNGFVVRHCRVRSVPSAKRLTQSLRSVLRYLFVVGVVDRELAPAVPTPAGWHGSSLPGALRPE